MNAETPSIQFYICKSFLWFTDSTFLVRKRVPMTMTTFSDTTSLPFFLPLSSVLDIETKTVNVIIFS